MPESFVRPAELITGRYIYQQRNLIYGILDGWTHTSLSYSESTEQFPRCFCAVLDAHDYEGEQLIPLESTLFLTFIEPA